VHLQLADGDANSVDHRMLRHFGLITGTHNGSTAVMKISWFTSQNATHFRVHANQFHKPAHVGANHLFAVYYIHALPNERHSRTPP